MKQEWSEIFYRTREKVNVDHSMRVVKIFLVVSIGNLGFSDKYLVFSKRITLEMYYKLGWSARYYCKTLVYIVSMPYNNKTHIKSFGSRNFK